MKAFYTILLALLLAPGLNAQFYFRGYLLNAKDSLPAAGALISCDQKGVATVDTQGFFSLQLPQYSERLTLHFFLPGCESTQEVVWHKEEEATLFFSCEGELNTVVLQPLTIQDILRISTTKRKDHFSEATQLQQGYYRNYSYGKHGLFNLKESHLYVLLHANGMKNRFAFSFERPFVTYPHEPIAPIGDDVLDFFNLNPTLSENGNALNYKSYADYHYTMVETSEDSVYTISYTCDQYITDGHGISNYLQADLSREGYESGTIRISKSDFALLSFERFCNRNPHFNYPRINNFVLPERKLVQEFVDAHYYISFEKWEGYYYVSSMSHRYTNDFFYASNHKLAERITECFEWDSNGLAVAVPEHLASQFEYEPNTQKWLLPSSNDPHLFGDGKRKYDH